MFSNVALVAIEIEIQEIIAYQMRFNILQFYQWVVDLENVEFNSVHWLNCFECKTILLTKFLLQKGEEEEEYEKKNQTVAL